MSLLYIHAEYTEQERLSLKVHLQKSNLSFLKFDFI